MNRILTALACGIVLAAGSAVTTFADAPTSSLMANSRMFSPAAGDTIRDEGKQSHALRQMSMFAIAPPEPRTFQRHDLIQVIVREQTQARSSHELDLDKRFRLEGSIPRSPSWSLTDLLQLQLAAGRTTDRPELRADFRNRFEGDGDFRRRDDLTARITAEVIEVLPNGNLILEARSKIKIDKEEAIMRVTGVCRPEDVTSTNTILSNQIHNLNINREHAGELRKTNQKGIITQVLDTLFAF